MRAKAAKAANSPLWLLPIVRARAKATGTTTAARTPRLVETPWGSRAARRSARDDRVSSLGAGRSGTVLVTRSERIGPSSTAHGGVA